MGVQKDRINPIQKNKFTEIKKIVKVDLRQRDLSALTEALVKNSRMGRESLIKTMNGRNSAESVQIIEAAIVFCDITAKKEGIQIKGGSYKSRVNAAGKLSSDIINPMASSSEGVDLWTPGLKSDDMVYALGGDIDEVAADKLIQLSETCIWQLSESDIWGLQNTALAAKNIGEECNNRRVVGEANYLLGESFRLEADFTPNPTTRDCLRSKAKDAYESSIEELEDDPRPIRGRARTIEVGGDLTAALVGFKKSVGILGLKDIDHPIHKYSYAHEILRSTRHKLNCLSAINEQSMYGTNTYKKEQEEIRTMVSESIKLHLKYLPLFEVYSNWWRIEWFMSEVLHANALISIREYQDAVVHLQIGMTLRLEMMGDSGEISDVERGNVCWWIKSVQGATQGFQAGQYEQLELIVDQLSKNTSKSDLKYQINNFIYMGTAPWKLKG